MWQELLRSRGELWRELSSDKKIERRWMLAILEFLERFENLCLGWSWTQQPPVEKLAKKEWNFSLE